MSLYQIVLAASVVCCGASLALAQAPKVVSGERLVLVDPEKIEEVAEALRRKTGATIEVVADEIGVLKMTLPAAEKAAAADAALDAAEAVDGVEAIELNTMNYLDGHEDPLPAEIPVAPGGDDGVDATPSDSRLGDLWYLNKVQAFDAWDTRTTTPVVVAVVDSGFHYDHEDLTNRWWRNQGEIAENGVDDDGNGFVDDRYGWDFVGNDRLAWCETYVDPNDGVTKWEAHGSHVAGSIGAQANNGVGIAGMSWGVQVMFVRAGQGTSLSDSAITSAVQYACNNGAKIINCSFSGTGGEAVKRAWMQYAGARGVLVFCSAGNVAQNIDASPRYPAALNEPNQVTVANMTSADVLSSSSCWGPTRVHLGAPGTTVLSTVPGDNSTVRQNSYAFFSGTSMATPITAGAAALVWANQPSLTHLQLKQRLLSSVDVLSSLDDRCTSEGRLNFRKFMGTTKPPTVQSLSSVVAECDGGKATVDFQTFVSDPSDDAMTVTWRVNGSIVKTQFGVATGSFVSLTHDFPHGVSSVSVQVDDGLWSASAATTVTVQDTTAPIVVLANDVVVPVDPGEIVATGVDLGSPTVEDACDPAPVITNDAPAEFRLGDTTVTWTVRDADGNVATAEQKVTVLNAAPIADAGSDRIVRSPRRQRQSVRLNGSKSSDPDLHDLTYFWSADGISFDDPTSPRPTGKFPLGKTSVLLTVTDEAGQTSSATVEVTFKLRNVTERRIYASYANYYCGQAYDYGYSSYAQEPYHQDDQAAYDTTLYAYLYSTYAGDHIAYGKKKTRGQALGDYLTLRYYQYNHSYYAELYWNQVYAGTGETYALYAAAFSQYARYYAEFDLTN